MKTTFFILAITCLILVGAITECKSDTAIGVINSIYHSPGSKGLFIEHRPNKIGVSAYYWTGSKSQNEPNMFGVSSTYRFNYKRYHFDIGLMYLNHKTKQTGTNLNFRFAITRDINRYIQWRILDHVSHGALFGISKDRANSGFNFTGIVFKLNAKKYD